MLFDETRSPYFFPSFLPPSPLFTAKLVNQVIRGGGGERERRNFTLERNGDGVAACGKSQNHQRRQRLEASASPILSAWIFCRYLFLIEEEEARSVGGGHVLRHVADL